MIGNRYFLLSQHSPTLVGHNANRHRHHYPQNQHCLEKGSRHTQISKSETKSNSIENWKKLERHLHVELGKFEAKTRAICDSN